MFDHVYLFYCYCRFCNLLLAVTLTEKEKGTGIQSLLVGTNTLKSCHLAGLRMDEFGNPCVCVEDLLKKKYNGMDECRL
ncbi:hypothetical protein V6N13_069817 [Hibiscus sabdariffa]|uniref:Uncharacterized protein n=2 Tax=Hibiscus sabdariffa TaxID=183260 RepID=A0ABR1ZRJ8_9ROSI